MKSLPDRDASSEGSDSIRKGQISNHGTHYPLPAVRRDSPLASISSSQHQVIIMQFTKVASLAAWSTLILVSSAWSQTQAYMNVKAQSSADVADAAMNQQWKSTYSAMKQLDAAYQGSGNDFKFAETALDSQRAWLHLRDQQCSIESAIFKGGSMAPMIGVQCQERMTRERTEDLKALLAQTR